MVLLIITVSVVVLVSLFYSLFLLKPKILGILAEKKLTKLGYKVKRYPVSLLDLTTQHLIEKNDRSHDDSFH